jgi:anti-sigma factor RsiW
MDEICETVRLSAMAIGDGEVPPLPAGEVRAHLCGCEACRQEVMRMDEARDILVPVRRRTLEADLWPGIEGRLRSRRGVFIPFLLLLVGYRILEVLPDLDLGVALKIFPLLLAVSLFALIRENPFVLRGAR